MPMIEFRYDPEKMSCDEARVCSAAFEGALRKALREVRPTREDYNVFLEGGPFDIHHNQPDLRIYVFYHPSWEFNEEELSGLPKVMWCFLESTLRALSLDHLSVTIRFYRRDGHASFSFNV